MKIGFRKLHRKIAPILFLPLLATALTGVAYRVGRSWFGLPGDVAEWLMVIHQGQYLGALAPVYVLLLGVGLIGMIVTGLMMLRRHRHKLTHHSADLDARGLHRILSPLLFLPLIISATTGVIYKLGESWLGLPRQTTALMLRLHQGTYLGPFLRAVYVLLVGLGLLGLLVSGISMVRLFRKRRQVSENQ